MMFEIQKPMLNTADLAELLGVKKQSVHKFRMLGKGPSFVKSGRIILYPRQAVLEWLEKNFHTPSARIAE
jgi:predicted DNA-binding transcriptional regulator AlpA